MPDPGAPWMRTWGRGAPRMYAELWEGGEGVEMRGEQAESGRFQPIWIERRAGLKGTPKGRDNGEGRRGNCG